MSSLPRKGRNTSSDNTANVPGSFRSTTKNKGKLSTGSFKGQFGGGGGSAGAETSGAAAAGAGGGLPSIALTTSTGTSSYLHRPAASPTSEDNASARSSLNKFASRASDIQSYASRYLDSIRSKSKSITGHPPKVSLPSLLEQTDSSMETSMAPRSTYTSAGGSSIPYLLTFRQGSRLQASEQNRPHSSGSSSLSRPGSFLQQRPYSLSPPPTASTTTTSAASSASSSSSSRSNYSEPRCAPRPSLIPSTCVV